jgi:hypothetical protein
MNCGILSIKKTLSEKDFEREYGTSWIWTAFDPVSRLIIAIMLLTVPYKVAEPILKYYSKG